MVNALSAIIHSAQSARRLDLEEKIMRKLGSEPVTVRFLTRRIGRFPAAHCLELLEDLEAEGKVRRIDDRLWQLRDCTTSATSSPRQLTLEA
jgi:predicted Rossmann fold nucleotide-binding protein DprA/Smf involved in DNA uptake